MLVGLSGRFYAGVSSLAEVELLSLLALLCLTVSGAWAQTYDNTVSINDGDVEVPDGEHWLITGTGETTENTICLYYNATVTLSGVNISTSSTCISCVGKNTIILADGTTNTLTSTGDNNAAIAIESQGETLTITGSTGVLNAKSGRYAAGIKGLSDCEINICGGIITATGGTNGACIGASYNNKCGNILISGGTITAMNGNGAACIGASQSSACGNITISGGTVTATATGRWSAGIGCGSNGGCGNILISGGTVAATGASYGAGIGCGRYSKCGTITIIEGVKRVTATKGSNGSYFGKTTEGTCSTVTIDGVEDATETSTFTHFSSEVSTDNSTWTLTHNRYDVTANLVDGAYWSTFYSEIGNHEAPEGTQVFAVNLTGSVITMTEIEDGIVKSGEGVVLKQATESSNLTTTIIMTLTEDASNGDFSTNSLQGTATSITTTGNAYVLNNGTQGVGFYKLSSGGTIGANKAYLTYSGDLAREFFLFEVASGIGAALNDNVEMINDNVYDLQGRRVSQPAKGLYIVNGKKYIKK